MGRLLTAIDPRLCQFPSSLPFTTCEQVYYLGAPLAHIVMYEQRLRELRLNGLRHRSGGARKAIGRDQDQS